MTPAEERRFDRTMNIVGVVAALALAVPIYFAAQAFAGNGSLGAFITLIVFPAAWMGVMATACSFLLFRHFRRRRGEVQS